MGNRRVAALAAFALLLAVWTVSPVPPVAAALPGGGADASSTVVRPVAGAVLRAFDPPDTRYGAGHRGVDLAAWPGDRVVAAMDGTVTFAGLVAGTSWVTVDHGGGLDTTYGGLDPRLVSAGMRVSAGQTLGHVGSNAGHVDWGARRQGEYLDPLSLLGRWRVRLAPLS